jgi:hypothetical protein
MSEDNIGQKGSDEVFASCRIHSIVKQDLEPSS